MGYRSKGFVPNQFTLYLGVSASLGALLGARIAIDIEGVLFNRILAIIHAGGGCFNCCESLSNKKLVLFSIDLQGKYFFGALIGDFYHWNLWWIY